MTSGVVSCGFGSAVLELFPQVEVNQDLSTKLHGFYVHFVTTASGKVLKTVLEPLCLGSRYRLFESNGMAGRVVRPQAFSRRYSPELYGIDTRSLPHRIAHYLGLSLFNPIYCTSLSFRIAAPAYVPSYSVSPSIVHLTQRFVWSTQELLLDALEYV